MTSELAITRGDKRSGSILFNDTGLNTTLDVAGKIEEIIVKEN
ncbi:hypothetical protein [Maribellus mangrovi]